VKLTVTDDPHAGGTVVRATSPFAMIRGEAARLAVGVLLSLAYFLAPVFLAAALTLGVFVWSTVGFFIGYALGIGVAVSLVLWIAARFLMRLFDRTWLGIVLHLIAGAGAAVATFGVIAFARDGSFLPLSNGNSTANAQLAVVAFAGICSCLGWLSVRLNTKPRAYDDALDGHSFAELAELLDGPPKR